MKRYTISFLAVTISLFFCACKKDNPLIVGTWTETSYVAITQQSRVAPDTATGSDPISYKFNADGSYEMDVSGHLAARGTYTFTGSQLTLNEQSSSTNVASITRDNMVWHTVIIGPRDTTYTRDETINFRR